MCSTSAVRQPEVSLHISTRDDSSLSHLYFCGAHDKPTIGVYSPFLWAHTSFCASYCHSLCPIKSTPVFGSQRYVRVPLHFSFLFVNTRALMKRDWDCTHQLYGSIFSKDTSKRANDVPPFEWLRWAVAALASAPTWIPTFSQSASWSWQTNLKTLCLLCFSWKFDYKNYELSRLVPTFLQPWRGDGRPPWRPSRRDLWLRGPHLPAQARQQNNKHTAALSLQERCS